MGAGNARLTRFDCTPAESAGGRRRARQSVTGRAPQAPIRAGGAALASGLALATRGSMGSKLAASIVGLALIGAPASAPRAGDRPRPAAASPARAADVGDSCQHLPAGKHLKLNLKPNTDLVDLVSWISAITCKQFIIPGSIPPQSKTVTIVSPGPITVAEAYDLFLDALDAVGLTVYSSRGVLRVVETSKIRFSPIPVKIDDQD